MQVVQSIEELKELRRKFHRNSSSIGFVPTMGYLHEGHLSLVDQSLKDNDKTVVSIFVNPKQFGPNEDFERYPRNFEGDTELLKSRGVDVLFFPSVEELYPRYYRSYVLVEELGDVLCGASRPGHFKGVTTIVLKLFNIVAADQAYFGRKDAQQAIILKKMAEDLNMDTIVRTLPIVRDSDGLALSSRNVYLSSEERKAALCLPRSLKKMKKEILNGERNVAKIIAGIKTGIQVEKEVQIDYVEALTLNSLQPVDEIDIDNTLIAAAVWVGKTRLIDNFILGDI